MGIFILGNGVVLLLTWRRMTGSNCVIEGGKGRARQEKALIVAKFTFKATLLFISIEEYGNLVDGLNRPY